MTTTAAAPAPVAQPIKNGATTPTQPSSEPKPATAAPTQTPDEIAAAKAEAAKWRTEYEKKNRETIATRRKAEDERKSFGEKLKKADEYERLQRDGKVSPLNAVSRLLGVPPEKALELLNTVAANGNTPTAESLAQALADQEAATEAKFKAREEEAKRAREEAESQAVENDRGQLHADATEFVKALIDDYPVFKLLGNEREVGAMLAQRISGPAFARYRAAIQYADGPARAAMMKGVADALETQVLSLGEGLTAYDKYKPKLAAKLTPPKQVDTVPGKSVAAPSVASQGQSQQRRSLGNDLTGSTTSEAPKLRTEEERIKAARAAGEALLKRS